MIFAFWRPFLCLVGAYLFGAFQALPFTFQAKSVLTGVPPEFFQALPYVMTIVVLVAVSSAGARLRLGAPAGSASRTSARSGDRAAPALPPDHPERRLLADEVHARPPEPVDTPSRASYVACSRRTSSAPPSSTT